ncbi:hypothetical protein QZH41_008085 [Actinostola sp. cb2023]|nr:hypothetical protein QZH41_008085 [Actinostola sp. cb2023]
MPADTAMFKVFMLLFGSLVLNVTPNSLDFFGENHDIQRVDQHGLQAPSTQNRVHRRKRSDSELCKGDTDNVYRRRPKSTIFPIDYERHVVDKSKAKGALCIDGTPAVYFLRTTTTSPTTARGKWIIVLPGGAWCSSKETCLWRSQTGLGSSKYAPDLAHEEDVDIEIHHQPLVLEDIDGAIVTAHVYVIEHPKSVLWERRFSSAYKPKAMYLYSYYYNYHYYYYYYYCHYYYRY